MTAPPPFVRRGHQHPPPAPEIPMPPSVIVIGLFVLTFLVLNILEKGRPD